MFKCLAKRARAFTVSAHRLNFFFFLILPGFLDVVFQQDGNGLRTGCFSRQA